MTALGRDERRRLRETVGEAERLGPVAAAVRQHRATVRADAERAAATLRARHVRLRWRGRGGQGWAVLALGPDDSELLGRVGAAASLTGLGPGEEQLLDDLAVRGPEAARETRVLLGLRRFVSSADRRRRAVDEARWLIDAHQRWGQEGVPAWLGRLEAESREPALPVPPSAALHPEVGLRDDLGPAAPHQEVVPVDHLASLPDTLPGLATVITRSEEARAQTVTAGEQVRATAVRDLLAQMPVDRLREATGERLRITALTEAGVTTVQQVLDRGPTLDSIPGVGPVTAQRMRGAAHTLRTLAVEDAPIRLDPDDRSPEASRLLERLHTWEVLRQSAKAADVVALAQAVLPLADRMAPGTTHLAVLGEQPVAALVELLEDVQAQATGLEETLHQIARADPWADFAARPATYFALLSELGLVEETGTYGDLPDDVVEAVRAQELDTSLLRVSLRGYQSFGARFALVQRKVVIGDEMGLGKTIEALAVLTHRATEGARWFLVVCPAAVISNWIREVDAKTDLVPRRLHGPAREQELRRWQTEGGVAVTTYGTLGAVWADLDGFETDALVVDEAHYVKNPEAQRSRRVSALIRRTQHVMLLTGTPMENRLSEFTTLVDYLQPDLLEGAGRSPVEFRHRVAPVYLRRNTEDVLVELPELIEVDEWLELTHADESAYREAVASGNFMAMRRAAFDAGMASAKLAHLVEIVGEAEDNGRRVLVFSFFRDVLDRVASLLPGRVFGPLTGSVPPTERQRVVDEFSRAEGGAVLVAQIQAVGVGLNIQAASVVVICEPQLKPTTEWQAIARARRMGQLQSVQVHRLLAEDSVDERIVELLATKTSTFDTFARVSETAESAPEAFDISEADLARQVVAAERARLFPEMAGEAPA